MIKRSKHHCNSVNETYIEHFKFAMSICMLLLKAASMALIHAFIPCLYEKDASILIKRLYKKVNKR